MTIRIQPVLLVVVALGVAACGTDNICNHLPATLYGDANPVGDVKGDNENAQAELCSGTAGQPTHTNGNG